MVRAAAEDAVRRSSRMATAGRSTSVRSAGHDPIAWAEALERAATMFVGEGWDDAAAGLLAVAGDLRDRGGDRL